MFLPASKGIFSIKIIYNWGQEGGESVKKIILTSSLSSITTIKTTGYGDCIGDTQVVSESFWLIIGDIGTLIQSSDSQTMQDK